MSFKVEKLNEGSGPIVPKGAYVKVHYTGKLTNGEVFDCSRKRGMPLDFQVGMGQVIRGWDEGITQLKKGQKAKLTCPPEYAYGDQGAGGKIPPGATLIFDVEVVDFSMSQPTSWGSCLFQFALVLMFLVFVFDKTLAPTKLYKPSLSGLYQRQLELSSELDEKSRELLDTETGQLKY